MCHLYRNKRPKQKTNGKWTTATKAVDLWTEVNEGFTQSVGAESPENNVTPCWNEELYYFSLVGGQRGKHGRPWTQARPNVRKEEVI